MKKESIFLYYYIETVYTNNEVFQMPLPKQNEVIIQVLQTEKRM
jgi:hypothetical protein